MAETRLTREGVAKYEEELEYLKTTRQMEIAEQIKVARSFGDLSENAEYDAAKNEQAKNQYNIAKLENMLRDAVIIDEESLDTETVNIGSVVVLKTADGDVMTFQIVGFAEANPMEGRISNESPVGRAIIGHQAGDEVDVQAPGGVSRMTILEIKKQ